MSENELSEVQKKFAYVFQMGALFDSLTVFENVGFGLHQLYHYDESKIVSIVTRTLELVGLADRMKHLPRQLSGGQEQRVAIARALVTDPTLLVADEPTGNLDAHSAADVLALLQTLNRDAGKTIVMVTHDPKAAAHARRVVYLEKGELLNGNGVKT